MTTLQDTTRPRARSNEWKAIVKVTRIFWSLDSRGELRPQRMGKVG